MPYNFIKINQYPSYKKQNKTFKRIINYTRVLFKLINQIFLFQIILHKYQPKIKVLFKSINQEFNKFKTQFKYKTNKINNQPLRPYKMKIKMTLFYKVKTWISIILISLKMNSKIQI